MIDAVPVALVLILLSMIWFVPAGAPLSMLHIWLWLRHPRSKSRYTIFMMVLILYLGLFVAFPLVCVYLDSYNTDLLALSLLSAIAFFAVRIPRDKIDWDHSPVFDLISPMIFYLDPE